MAKAMQNLKAVPAVGGLLSDFAGIVKTTIDIIELDAQASGVVIPLGQELPRQMRDDRCCCQGGRYRPAAWPVKKSEDAR